MIWRGRGDVSGLPSVRTIGTSSLTLVSTRSARCESVGIELNAGQAGHHLLTSLKGPGQEYRDVGPAPLIKGADQIDLHNHSDVIGIVCARHLNLAVRFSVRCLSRSFEALRPVAFLGWAQESARAHFRPRR